MLYNCEVQQYAIHVATNARATALGFLWHVI